MAMKCVGVNASADPWMCFSYTGCEAGMVVAVADEPGQQSSGQSAQDDRTFLNMHVTHSLNQQTARKHWIWQKKHFTLVKKPIHW